MPHVPLGISFTAPTILAAQWRVTRIVVLLDRKDLPSAGAGETPIVGIAPALGRAIFEATGVRLRSLPLVPDGVQESGRRQSGQRFRFSRKPRS